MTANEPPFHSPRTGHGDRETVVITVPPDLIQDLTLSVHDGLRLAIEYGNTTREFDLVTRQWLGTTTTGQHSPTRPPSIHIARLGPADLDAIRAVAEAAVEHIFGGDHE